MKLNQSFHRLLIMAMTAFSAFSYSCQESEPADLTFIGDSLIAKWDVASSFPGMLTENFGKSGCSVDYLQRFSGKFTGCKVAVLVGTNDHYRFMGEDMHDYLESYLSIITATGAGRIYLFSLLPRDDGKCESYGIEKFNEAVKSEIANYPNVTYIDVYDDFIKNGRIDLTLYEPDRLHINESGYAILQHRLNTRL